MPVRSPDWYFMFLSYTLEVVLALSLDFRYLLLWLAINQRFPNPLLNLLMKLTDLRKSIYSLDYWFITKDVKGYKSTTRWRSQTKDLLFLWSLAPSMVAHGGPPTAVLSGFYEGFIPLASLSNHWPLAVDPASTPSPLSRDRGGRTLILRWGPSTCQFINITKDTFIILIT